MRGAFRTFSLGSRLASRHAGGVLAAVVLAAIILLPLLLLTLVVFVIFAVVRGVVSLAAGLFASPAGSKAPVGEEFGDDQGRRNVRVRRLSDSQDASV
jgi:hypothetical protein